MISIRQVLEAYHLRDIFNCDETGLYWRRTLDRSLSTKDLPGVKQSKACIIVYFCCNADGFEKSILWFIGTACNFRAFAAASINVNNLGL